MLRSIPFTRFSVVMDQNLENYDLSAKIVGGKGHTVVKRQTNATNMTNPILLGKLSDQTLDTDADGNSVGSNFYMCFCALFLTDTMQHR